MDVQRGHCWRCEVPLEQTFHCPDCKMAVYCSTKCERGDRIRHGSRECPLFGTRSCNKCRKKGTMRECGGCNYAWYCNQECQKSDWANHKESCKMTKKTMKEAAAELRKDIWQLEILPLKLQINRLDDFPDYFGNTIAKDFLQLENNEWSDGSMKKADLNRDYHILSTGCGDLRNTVLTIASLPARYQGSLHMTLNDYDPYVMARNVLFLFMLVRFADTEGIESSLTTIWYSVHITKKEYDLIKTSLDELIQMTPQSLKEVTQGLVKVQDEDLAFLSQVWEKWRSLECQREKPSSINLRKQRKTEFDKFNRKIKNEYGEEMSYAYTNQLRSPSVKTKIEEWFDHGLFLPEETNQRLMSFDNPTLTGIEIAITPKAHLKYYALVYCIRSDSLPFKVWDCLRVRESETRPCSSPMVMYHNYITKLLQKVKNLVQQKRIHIQVSLADGLNFPLVHKSLKIPDYDRIFTSNLSDYIGFAELLQKFKPLLNQSNYSSVIVTEAMNWIAVLPQTRNNSKVDIGQCAVAYCQDTGDNLATVLSHITEISSHTWLDYFDNAPYFIAYLRAQIMAGGRGVQPLTNVPSFGEVMKYNGLQMRDFRKKLNRLVPFQYRVNNRDLTLISATDRTVEWCLPHTDD